MARPHALQRVRLCFDFDTPDALFDFMVRCRRRGVIPAESAVFYAYRGSVGRTAIPWEATFLVRLESERGYGWYEFKRRPPSAKPRPALDERSAQLARGEPVAEDIDTVNDAAVRQR